MFGYVNINRQELSEEAGKIYQSYYCGLCRKLKETAGRRGQLLLNYDMTFLVVLLTGLYEPQENEEASFTCRLHPTKKRCSRINEFTKYAADMNIILSFQNFEDDWRDNHSYAKKAFARLLGKDYLRIKETYPRQVAAVEQYLSDLEEMERVKETNIDLVAGLTGTMLGEIFAYKEDMWADELRCLGFYLGKFIYLMDAYEDVAKDKKNGCYNPLIRIYEEDNKDFDTFCKLMLTSMISEAAKSFERLPILLHADILRNILYSGVWSRYEYNQLKRQKKEASQVKRAKHSENHASEDTCEVDKMEG